MYFEPVMKNPWFRFFAAVAALLLLVLAGYLIVPVLTPVLFALILAYALQPVVLFLERRRIPRMTAILLLLAIIAVAGALLPLVVVSGVIGEADRLVQSARTGVTEGYFDQWLDRLPLRELVVHLGWAPADTPEFNERAVIAEKIGELVRGNAVQFVRSYGDQIANMSRQMGGSAAQLAVAAARFILGVLGALVSLSLVIVVTVYLLKDYDKIGGGVLELVPPRYRGHLTGILGKIDVQLRSFLRGQMLVCLAMMVMYGTGFFLSGVPFALPIALMGGAATIIPYVGPAITMVPAVLLTLVYYGIDGHIAGVGLTFVVVQLLESYILTPRIVGSQVGLGPVWVIMSILVFSSLFGFLGLLMAVPVAAVLKVLVLEGLALYRRSAVFTDSPPSPG